LRLLCCHRLLRLLYMKLLNIPLGLIINFNELKLTDGISMLVLPRALGVSQRRRQR
jgi:hypothetical protein